MLTAVAVGLTVFVAPRTNRIYYDEQIYQSVGQNLADLKLAQMCNDGIVEYGRLQCWSGEYNKQPYAYPHVLSLAYRLFGVRPATAFVVNAAVMGLTVCCLYLLVFILFGDRDAAFFAGASRRTHARADPVVGDGGRRALGLAGVRRCASWRGARLSIEKHRGARGRRCRRRPMRSSFDLNRS